jgi:hypothetical protein
MDKKLLAWGAAAAVLLTVSQVSCTPRRSDDVRVELKPNCPVARGTVESGARLPDIPVAVGEAVAKPLVQLVAQVAKSAAQGHSSPALSGSWADYYYVTDGKGQLQANRPRWGCLVVQVRDLRAQRAAPAAEPAADPAASARVYLEAAIEFSADGEAFELQPQTLRFREPMEGGLLASAARDLAFRIDFRQPGVAAPHAATTLDFRSIVPDPQTQLGRQELAWPVAKRTGWLPGPPVDDAVRLVLAQESARLAKTPGVAEVAKAPRAAEAAAGPGAAEAAKSALRAKLAKSTVTVAIVETREGSMFWKLMAETFEGVLPSFRGDGAGPPATEAK